MADRSLKAQIRIEERASKSQALAVILGAVTMAVLAVGGLGAATVLIVLGYPPAVLLAAIPGILWAVARLIQALRSPQDGGS